MRASKLRISWVKISVKVQVGTEMALKYKVNERGATRERERKREEEKKREEEIGREKERGRERKRESLSA